MGSRGIPFAFQVLIAVGVGALGALAAAQIHMPRSDTWSSFAPISNSHAAAGGSQTADGRAHAGCNIKGNISQTTGERIYHVPGQKYYDATVIDPSRGERWFCSEAEARAAGWRRSRI